VAQNVKKPGLFDRPMDNVVLIWIAATTYLAAAVAALATFGDGKLETAAGTARWSCCQG
jgi:hypothetical protein